MRVHPQFTVGRQFCSGNSPGIQREASAAGKARRSGARVLSDDQHAVFDERGDDAAGLAFAGADDAGGVAARQFAAVEHGFEYGAGFWRQPVEADFLFGPEQDARAQLVGCISPSMKVT